MGNATIIFIPYIVRARSGTSQSFFLAPSPTAGVLHIRHRGSGARLLDILNGSAAVWTVLSPSFPRWKLIVNLQSFLIIVFISCFWMKTKNRRLFVNIFERTILGSTY